MRLTAPTEAEIQKSILAYLRLHGAFVVRVNSGAVKVGSRLVRFNDSPGCPDILACVGGRFIGIECKRKGGRLRDSQRAALDAIRKAGGVSFVATSVDDVQRALRLEGLV